MDFEGKIGLIGLGQLKFVLLNIEYLAQYIIGSFFSKFL